MNEIYRTSPIKRRRRSRAEIGVIEEAIYETLAADPPMTLRQLFYQLVSRGTVPKTEAEYKGTVGRLLVRLRRAGIVPYEWVSDNTRWMRKPRTYSSLTQALQQAVKTYRRAIWTEQPVYVEVWLEKDALAGVLMEETEPWDVPLMVNRGFGSETYIYEAAQWIRQMEKPTYIYYVGDHDPSGVAITRDLERRLRLFAPEAEIHFSRLAVTEEQIFRLNLPTRPTKTTDSRSRNFEGESVDVDAIPASILRGLVREAITGHLDHGIYQRVIQAETLERASLERFARAWSMQ